MLRRLRAAKAVAASAELIRLLRMSHGPALADLEMRSAAWSSNCFVPPSVLFSLLSLACRKFSPTHVFQDSQVWFEPLPGLDLRPRQG